MPKEEASSSTGAKILRWILSTFRMIVITVELVVIIGFLSRFWLDVRNSDLDDEIKQKEALILSYAQVEKDFRLAQKRLDIFKAHTVSDTTSSPYLESASSALPQDVQLTSFTKEGAAITIRGASLSEQSISQYLVNLRAKADFRSAVLSQVESFAESPLINFTITVSGKGQG